MIFAHTLDKLIQGHKWQTRRLVKPDESFVESGAIKKGSHRLMYVVGRTYAVQPNRGKKAVARILLTGLRREQVHAITEEDAHAEGFVSRDEFLATWYTIYGLNGDLNREVWVFEFKLDTIIDEAFKVICENRATKDRYTHHGHDVSSPIERLSGISLYSWNYKTG